MLSDSDLDAARAARARNARRHAGLPYLDDSPPRSDGLTRHFIVLNAGQVSHLLIFGHVIIERSSPKHAKWKHRCPWGSPGEFRWVHEPVIMHPTLGVVFTNNPNWAEFRRKHTPLGRMPVDLRRLVVRVILAERTRLSWRMRLQRVPKRARET